MIEIRGGVVARVGLVVALAGVLAVVGCGSPAAPREAVPRITIALMSVPSDVFCLEVIVTGATSVTRRFDVTPGTSALITVTGLAAGATTVDEKAYGVACNMVMPGVTVPTWVATMPIAVTLVAGQITDLAFVLKRPPRLRLSNDFQDSPVIMATPAPVVFATAALVGGTALTQDVAVSNNGTVPAPFAAAMTGSDAGQFSVTTTGCPAAGAPLAVGAICTVTVRFAPTTAGPKTAHLSLGMPAALLVPVSGTATMISLGTTPGAVNFGSVFVANPVTAQSIVVANTGTLPVPFATTITGSDSALFSISANTCPPAGMSLAVGASCTVTVAHTPTTLGAKAAVLNLGSPIVTTVPLASTVVSPLTATPMALAFGTATVGTSPANQVVTIVNNGSTSITLGTAIAGAGAAQFSNAGTTCAAALPGGASCTVTVRFAPTSAGAKNASLTFGAPVLTSVALTGTGAVAMIAAMPAMVAFPNTLIGAAVTQAVTVTNTGVASVPFAASIMGPDFSTTMTTCPMMGSLAPGMSCAITVRFLPTVVGARMGSLALGMPAVTTVPLSGTGITAAVTVTPPALAFGNVMVGSPGATQVVGINNTGPVDASFAPAITGTDAGLFMITANNCPAPLVPGASCAITVRVTMPSVGAKSASLAVGGLSTVPLSATGVAGQTVSALPAVLAFGNVALGAPAATQTVRVVNTSTAAVPLPLAFGGPDAGQFTVDSSSCPASLPVGGPCSIVVRFIATMAGPRSAVLNLGMAATVALTGNASTASVTTMPTSLAFISVPINGAGPMMPITITNVTAGAITVPLTVTGADPAQFVLMGTSCPLPPATLAASASCSAHLRFMPVGPAGNKHATLSIGSPVLGYATMSGAAL